MARKGSKSPSPSHRFGGEWTSVKLDVLAKYLSAYTTALRDKPSEKRPFRKGYIDAFAGTGYRDATQELDAATPPLPFPDLAASEPRRFSMAPRGSR